MLNAHEVLQSMITPAVLISAAGTLILSTSTRISKVSDRVRDIALVFEPNADAARPDAEFARTQVTLLARRLVIMRVAMTLLYFSLGTFVTASLLIGASAMIEAWDGWVAVAVALAGGLMLLAACVYLASEAWLASRGTLHEIDFIRARVTARVP